MVGRTPFDPRKCCPFPHMTQPVLPGEEFEALEYVSRNENMIKIKQKIRILSNFLPTLESIRPFM